MSMTTGWRPAPSPGRWTSPTRFTPSLAGIVTSASVVVSAACAGAAAATAANATAAHAASPLPQPRIAPAGYLRGSRGAPVGDLFLRRDRWCAVELRVLERTRVVGRLDVREHG